MRNSVFCSILLIAAIFCSSSFAQETRRVNLRPSGELPFQGGEKLTYSVSYGILKGGEASITVENEELYEQSVYHSVLKGYTTGLVGAIYKVDDVYESWFRHSDLLPLKHIRNIREGSYRYYDLATFDQEANLVVSQKGGIMSMPEGILDLACVCFYMRSLPLETLEPGDELYFNTFFAHELFPFSIIYKGRETITTKAGTVECLKFVPIVEPGRIFNKKDDATAWFTADGNKIPVLAVMDTKMGNFSIELISHEGLKFESGLQ